MTIGGGDGSGGFDEDKPLWSAGKRRKLRGVWLILAALICPVVGAAEEPGTSDEVPGIKDWLIGGGVTPSLIFTGDTVANLSGGARRGQTYGGILHMQVALDGDRIAATPGLTAWLDVLWINGGQPGAFVGDAQGVSNTAAPPAVRMYEAWVQYNFPGARSGHFAAWGRHGRRAGRPDKWIAGSVQPAQWCSVGGGGRIPGSRSGGRCAGKSSLSHWPAFEPASLRRQGGDRRVVLHGHPERS